MKKGPSLFARKLFGLLFAASASAQSKGKHKLKSEDTDAEP